jgi:hypothetical protein
MMKTHHIILIFFCFLLVMSCAGRPGRGEIEEYIHDYEISSDDYEQDNDKRYTYARMLFHAGSFENAKDILMPLLDEEKPLSDSLFIMAELHYLSGDYSKSETLLQDILRHYSHNAKTRIRAQIYLLFIYYQLNRYEEAHDLFKEEKNIVLPYLELMKSFDGVKPYQLEWHNEHKVSAKFYSVVPFVYTDPLPLIKVQVEGVDIYAFIDTGGDLFILDSEIAAQVGAEIITSVTGVFGGGKKGDIQLAKVHMLSIGDVTMREVPVWILPTKRFSPLYEKADLSVGGIIGTGVLHQFLSTLDYENGRLILRPQSEKSIDVLQEEMKDKKVTEIPFYLWATHKMIARGRLNDKDNLTFFIDSGLASEACFIAPKQTLEYAGIPLPEVKIPEKSVGGGGEGLWPIGLFHIDTLGLDGLLQYDVTGDYGTLGEETYWEDAGGITIGFIQDGIISHNYLRSYDSWTIDFIRMKMVFAY